MNRLEGILVSGREGMIEPNPGTYRFLIARFDIDTSRAVFIDDGLRTVEGARQAGMRAIHFSGAQQLRIDLKTLGPPTELIAS